MRRDDFDVWTVAAALGLLAFAALVQLAKMAP